MSLSVHDIDPILQLSLAEDIGKGDITSALTIPAGAVAEFTLKARETMTVCGVEVAKRAFALVSQDVSIQIHLKDGQQAKAGDIILSGKGPAHPALAAERVALNFLRQLSGVATRTRQFVDAVEGTKASILDTRKTIPGLRFLQKYAVRMGGGQNHRFGLDDAILIKDNHIHVCGGITPALTAARNGAPHMRIEVECDTLEQVEEALRGGADIILLDNMSLEQLRAAVKRVDGQIPLEASGNVRLETVRAIAQTGVDYISAGILTHSALSVDIGMDMEVKNVGNRKQE